MNLIDDEGARAGAHRALLQPVGGGEGQEDRPTQTVTVQLYGNKRSTRRERNGVDSI